MVYSKGNKMISIEKQPIFGKVKPELYIGEDNHLLKVASFGNVDKAEKFEEWLRYFFGDMLVKEKKAGDSKPISGSATDYEGLNCE